MRFGSWYTFIGPLKLRQLYAHPLAEDVLVPVEAPRWLGVPAGHGLK